MSTDSTNFEVDTSDTKTSKLETGIRLAQIITIGVFLVWVGLVSATIMDIPYINSEAASGLVDVITPVIVTTITVSIVAWIINREKLSPN